MIYGFYQEKKTPFSRVTYELSPSDYDSLHFFSAHSFDLAMIRLISTWLTASLILFFATISYRNSSVSFCKPLFGACENA